MSEERARQAREVGERILHLLTLLAKSKWTPDVREDVCVRRTAESCGLSRARRSGSIALSDAWKMEAARRDWMLEMPDSQETAARLMCAGTGESRELGEVRSGDW